jgi:hypothetical protein
VTASERRAGPAIKIKRITNAVTGLQGPYLRRVAIEDA